MRQLKFIIKVGGVVVGVVLNLIGYISAAREVASLGLPAYMWYGIGSLILLVSVGFVIYGLYEENNRLRITLETYQDQDPLLNEAKKAHFADLYKLVESWKYNLVLDINDPMGWKYDIVFETNFNEEDWKLNTHFIKGIHWNIDSKEKVSVWFPVEREPLFQCLESHLDNRIWELFKELKKEIAEAISKVPHLQKGEHQHNPKISSITYKLVDELDIVLGKHEYFPNKCRACPDYSTKDK